MTVLPSSLALTSIPDGSNIVAADHRNNYTAIQTFTNSLLAILSAGTTGQALVSSGGTTVAWGSGPGLVQIQEIVLGSAAATFDFTSVPGTFRSLLVEGYVRTADVAATASIGMHLNNDTSAVYDYTSTSAVDNASPADGGAFGATFAFVGNASAASAVSDSYSPIVVEIPNYKSAHHKTYLSRGISKGTANSAGNLDLRTLGGYWRNNATVNRVTFYVTSGLNFAADSVMTLYGLV